MEKGMLIHGVELDGQRHFTFSVRLPVVGDTIAALEETQDEKGTTDGAAAGMHYRVGILARVLTLDGVECDKVTTELLLDQLSDEDFDLIDAQVSAVKKKLMQSRPPSVDTAPLSSPSAATA
ncbi:hypothetical protein ABRP58_16480 [Pectobacterium aroidearum]|uniref:hypothetical protein n=1 Tax=Pectobacterium aroidearum TaxID=1201031 RepID=UPI0015F55E6A|nr:hypothetical protein [Pectobacterium aroidearum]MBA5602501.1 hypothetical protein [Pectobacterium aroidearum]MDY4388563.1 hypothetical protein [Pectobacterium aroidearum]